MTNLIKTILLILSITLGMAFISCQNNDKTGNDGSFKNSDLAGTWTSGVNSFTIDSSGKVNFTYQGYTYNENILSMDMEGYDVWTSSYNNTYNPNTNPTETSERKKANFHFSSSSSCDVTIEEQKYSGKYPNGEWQTQKTITVGNFTK
ncbi:hypothetical protein [uncultured Brachyspira sp.]|uniref:hypothetical protein n=1 Tax=uncultured Brachyspira sp. TaxID=221953 RepID=UPI0027DE3383|nr:hypothetical protein [uncultured Brachyspira sp.]